MAARRKMKLHGAWRLNNLRLEHGYEAGKEKVRSDVRSAPLKWRIDC